MFMKIFHKTSGDSPNANKNSSEEEQSIAPLVNETETKVHSIPEDSNSGVKKQEVSTT